MKRESAASLVLPAKFSPLTEFFDVEGIPVTVGAGLPPSYGIAWEAPAPRSFPAESAHRNGAPIDESEFRALVASTQAAS
jgi:hypothetical protein